MKRSSQPAPDPVASSDRIGFWIAFSASPAMTERDLRRFSLAMEEFLIERELEVLGGSQMRLFIGFMPEQEPSRLDAVAVLDWCLGTGLFTAVALSEFTAQEQEPPAELPVLRVRCSDLAVQGVRLLFRLGRASAEQFVDLLGGWEVVEGGMKGRPADARGPAV